MDNVPRTANYDMDSACDVLPPIAFEMDPLVIHFALWCIALYFLCRAYHVKYLCVYIVENVFGSLAIAVLKWLLAHVFDAEAHLSGVWWSVGVAMIPWLTILNYQAARACFVLTDDINAAQLSMWAVELLGLMCLVNLQASCTINHTPRRLTDVLAFAEMSLPYLPTTFSRFFNAFIHLEVCVVLMLTAGSRVCDCSWVRFWSTVSVLVYFLTLNRPAAHRTTPRVHPTPDPDDGAEEGDNAGLTLTPGDAEIGAASQRGVVRVRVRTSSPRNTSISSLVRDPRAQMVIRILGAVLATGVLEDWSTAVDEVTGEG